MINHVVTYNCDIIAILLTTYVLGRVGVGESRRTA